MIGVYFSGTGNSKYCIEKFLQGYDAGAKAFSIENEECLTAIAQHEDLVFCYPVQFSSLPKIVRDFIVQHGGLWRGKRVFVMATMGLFSGDGAGVLARLLRRYGAVTVGGLHLKMPDSVSDEKVLKRPLEKNRRLVDDAGKKAAGAARLLRDGKPPQEGMGLFCHLAGLFGQRLYFFNRTKNYTDKLKIDVRKCIGCGQCAAVCPMKNITLREGAAEAGSRCTMCYRCISRCPKQAVTLLGKQVAEQCRIEKYL
ncbi:MAG: EFR1 family ferrodoxin [Oscillospiraceae bacterium]|nr:EFR1 family ferrodoxin [Oscillospiraceae bacterium]